MRTFEPRPHQVNSFAGVLSIPKLETWLRKNATSESGHQMLPLHWMDYALAADAVKAR
jgi:hypothetical protein